MGSAANTAGIADAGHVSACCSAPSRSRGLPCRALADRTWRRRRRRPGPRRSAGEPGHAPGPPLPCCCLVRSRACQAADHAVPHSPDAVYTPAGRQRPRVGQVRAALLAASSATRATRVRRGDVLASKGQDTRPWLFSSRHLYTAVRRCAPVSSARQFRRGWSHPARGLQSSPWWSG